MIRVLTASATALVLGAAAAHAGNDAHTTRVVPEHVHGATVTVEEGVRVFRPLPSDRHVIVNPEGETEIEVKVHEYDGPRGAIRR
jgi:hypothetical protein